MTNFTATEQYETSSKSDDTIDTIETDQQTIQKKTTIRRKFHWVAKESFSDDVEAQIATA